MLDGRSASRARFCAVAAVVLNALLLWAWLLVRLIISDETAKCDVSHDDWCDFGVVFIGVFVVAVLYVLAIGLWSLVLRSLRRRWCPRTRRIWLVPLVTVGLHALGSLVLASEILRPTWLVLLVAVVFAPTFATWLWLAVAADSEGRQSSSVGPASAA